MNDKPRLDEEALSELQEVMEDEFDVLIDTFLKDSADRIRSLRHGIEIADAEAFARTAHSFKGSSINMGAPGLGELCLKAEQSAKANRLNEAAELVEAIESEFDAVDASLKRFLA